MAEKRIDDAKLGGISGGTVSLSPQETVTTPSPDQSMPQRPVGGNAGPEADAPGSGTGNVKKG